MSVQKCIRFEMMMQDDWPDGDDLVKAQNEVVAACSGDARSAIRSLIVALAVSDMRRAQLEHVVSKAYARDLFYRDLSGPSVSSIVDLMRSADRSSPVADDRMTHVPKP